MSEHVLRILEDHLSPGAESDLLPACNRIVYVIEGDVTISTDGNPRNFVADSGWHDVRPSRLKGGTRPARLWRWELVPRPVEDDGVVSGDGIASVAKLAEAITLDAKANYLMRLDRVDFPIEGIAYTHIHWGPGIRCLLRGGLSVKTAQQQWQVTPGGTWFERGPDPIYAQASASELTSFVRVMVLPRALKGQTSIRYVEEEDAGKPKTQEYTRYVDEFIKI